MFFIFFLTIRLLQVKFRLKELTKENNSLKETLNSQPQRIEKIIDTIQITQVPAKLEFTLTGAIEQNNQQHYYIVKEIIKNKSSNVAISSKEYEFANENLYTSKTEARLFYDNKLDSSSNNDENSILEYELYIANNVFYDTKIRDSSRDVSIDGIKRYLLIDNLGKDQIDARNFESFALRAASDIISQKNGNANQATYICTKNSFLDGNYKD